MLAQAFGAAQHFSLGAVNACCSRPDLTMPALCPFRSFAMVRDDVLELN